VLNRRARLEEVMRRDGPVCVWCGRHIDTALVVALERLDEAIAVRGRRCSPLRG